jgi:hypothetical protein
MSDTPDEDQPEEALNGPAALIVATTQVHGLTTWMALMESRWRTQEERLEGIETRTRWMEISIFVVALIGILIILLARLWT